jgi:hypothetical protein
VVVAMLEPQVRIDPSFFALEAAIDRLAADDTDAQTIGLGDDIRALRRSIDRLEAECARRLVRFAAGREHLADNVVSTVAWLRHECGLSASAAVQRVEVARHLPELPATWAGFLCGDIGFQNAALVARTARVTGRDAAQQLDQIFADSAKQLLPERMRIVTAMHATALTRTDRCPTQTRSTSAAACT